MEPTRKLLLLFTALVLCACGPAAPVLRVYVDDLGSAQVTALTVKMVLPDGAGGTRSEGPQVVSSRLDQLRVELPAGLRSLVTLRVGGNDSRGCEVAAAEPLPVLIEGDEVREVHLSLRPTEQAGCRLVILVDPPHSDARVSATGITCQADCAVTLASGATSILRAASRAGTSRFLGWSGACTGQGECKVTIDAGVTTVTAHFAPAQLCAGDGFCWERPVPQGNSLAAVWRGGDTLWAVGSGGTILRFLDTQWGAVASGTTRDLNGIWGSGPDNIWIVGKDGLVLRWDGQRFSSMAVAQDPPPTLISVWGFAPDDVWLGGAGGALYHWDGAALRAVAAGTEEPIYGLWGSGRNDVWAVTADYANTQGTILHYDGVTWRSVWKDKYPVFSVWGSGRDDVWFTGAVLLHWQGGQLVPLPLPQGQTLTGVWGSSADDVWSAGLPGRIFRLGPGGARPFPSGTDAVLLRGHGLTANDHWAVGTGGGLAHWDGLRWRAWQDGAFSDLRAIAGVVASDLWAAGQNGSLLRRRQGQWTTADVPGEIRNFRGLAALAQDDVWAVGELGLVTRWDGYAMILNSAADKDDFVLDDDFEGVFGVPKQAVFAAGGVHEYVTRTGKTVPGYGTLVRWGWEGGGWKQSAAPTAVQQPLNAIWGSTATDVWAVGGDFVRADQRSHGTILHFDGQSWVEDGAAADCELKAVWGSGPRDVYAVGYRQVKDPNNPIFEGVIWRYDGAVWQQLVSIGDAQHRNGSPLLSIRGTGPNDIWVGGQQGTLVHFDGQKWSNRGSGLRNDIQGIWTRGGHTWLVGTNGSVVKRGPAPQPFSLGAGVDHALPGIGIQVIAGDLDSDGKVDLAALDFLGLLTLLRGDGQGGFAAQPASAVGHGMPRFMTASGDLNGDGRLDVLVASEDNKVVAMLGDGRGGFSVGATLPLPPGQQPRLMAARDLDGDGKPEVIVADEAGNGALQLLRIDGRGGFQLSDRLPLPDTPNGLALADLNGDGRPDLVVLCGKRATIEVFLNQGGAFGAAVESEMQGSMSSSFPGTLAVADLDGDGQLELVVAGSGGLTSLRHLGAGRFQVLFSDVTHEYLKDLALADMNADGWIDALGPTGSSQSVSVSLGDGTAGFDAVYGFPTFGLLRSVVAVDLNGDRRPDVALTDGNTERVVVRLNTSGR